MNAYAVLGAGVAYTGLRSCKNEKRLGEQVRCNAGLVDGGRCRCRSPRLLATALKRSGRGFALVSGWQVC